MKNLKWVLSFAVVITLSGCALFNRSGTSVQDPNNNPIAKTELQRDYQDYSENSVYLTSAIPLNGTPQVLVIPIWFTNSSSIIGDSYKNNILEDIQTAFEGTESETGWHSVKTYYETLSQGSLSLAFTFSDWYECGYSYQAAGSSSTGQQITTNIIKEATDWYFEQNPGESRTDYDYNEDGYIDGIMAIYAAPDYYQTGFGSYGNLWAYTYWVQEEGSANRNNPAPNAYFWSSYDFMYGATNAVTRTGNIYHYGDCTYLNIDTHTFIHETGHALGYDNDFYDYGGTCSPAGGFSMQDNNVGSHDPYTVMASGWADPYIPTESCTLTIRPFQESRDLILLTPEWNDSDSPFDEYLLLELYTPTGLNEFDATHQYGNIYPKGPSSTGIRLWHVDARLTSYNGSSFSTTLFTDPTSSRYASRGAKIAMSNTYSGDHISVLGRSYANYNQLQLLRDNTRASYDDGDFMKNSDLFRNGSDFSMSIYGDQFYRNGKLNSNKELGWSFSVSISGSGSSALAEIALYKD